MSAPAISVIVPTRGGVGRLPGLLTALAAQELDESWEAIVVIDGDVDGSSVVVDRASVHHPVRRVTFDVNLGRSAALNAGFAESRGSVVVRCDDDLVPRPDYLARHLAAHADGEVGVVGLYRNVYPETTYARVYGRAWDQRFRREAYRIDSKDAWRYWAGNVSVTREMWARVGPYDTEFRAYGWEDVDWGFRLQQIGVPVVVDRALETEHRIAATTTATRMQRAFYSGAARRRFELKHGITSTPAAPANAWERIVDALAKGLDENRSQRLGSMVDAGARVVPDRVAGKLVALSIDAAARAGHTGGTTVGAI